uniref:Phytoene synthase n=1 Tax=Attheya septentrionalis TaxID=420275 RepID=A0A7S2XRQ9_9STRA
MATRRCLLVAARKPRSSGGGFSTSDVPLRRNYATLIMSRNFVGQRRPSFSGCNRTPTSTIGLGRNLSGSTKSKTQQEKEDHQQSVELVRTRDFEGYLCGLLMPSHARESYFAVRSLNVELASIKDGRRKRNVGGAGDDPSLASRLRMQWWREAINGMYEDSPVVEEPSVAGFLSHMSTSQQHSPIVRSVRRATQSADLTRRFLDRLVDAREADLEQSQMTTLQQLTEYSEETSSSVLYLSLECAGVRDEDADSAAYHVGVGSGLVSTLRSTVYRAEHHEEVALPVDVMEKYGVEDQFLLSGGQTNDDSKQQQEALQNAVREVAHLAAAHLARARQLQSRVPKAGRPSLLPAVPALMYLQQLQSAQYNVFDPVLLQPELNRFRLLLHLSRSWLTGVF